jgi:hypothetical protein
MFECGNASHKDSTKEEDESVIASYGALEGQTCGMADDNRLVVNEAETLVASADACKLACWKSSSAAKCHGFTYENDGGRCTFHQDVLDGPVEKNPKATCFYKKVGS